MNKEDRVKMRVLLITSEFYPHILGGLGTHVTNLVKELSRNKNIELTVATFKYPNATKIGTRLDLPGVNTIEASPNFETNDIGHFYQIIQANYQLIGEIIQMDKEYDIIHAHDFLVAHAALTLKEIFRIPLITTLHDTLIGRFASYENLDSHGKYYSKLQRELVDKSNYVICCSESMKMEIRNFYHADKSKLIVIYNGVNEAESNRIKNNYNQNKDCISIIFVGRLSKDKGLEDLIEAFKILRKKHTKIKLIIIGDKSSDYGKKLIDRVAGDKTIKKDVSFVGFQSNDVLAESYYNSDIAVIPSHYEPFGIVALEAASHGLPIVVSDVGGLREIVDKLGMGKTTPPKDPRILSINLEYLINNPEVRKHTGISNQKKASKIFSWRKISQDTLQVYTKLYDTSND